MSAPPARSFPATAAVCSSPRGMSMRSRRPWPPSPVTSARRRGSAPLGVRRFWLASPVSASDRRSATSTAERWRVDMRRVLIVAYYFPPLGGAGSLRVSGLATHLPEYGWEPTVLAPRNGAYYRDPQIPFSERQVIRTPSIELSRTGKRLLRAGGTDLVAAEPDRARVAVRSAARAALYFPDAQVGWYAPALVTARRALREHRFDAIVSSSFPITAHLVARRLHRRMRIPWIAEFRDPWSAELARRGDPATRAARLERS